MGNKQTNQNGLSLTTQEREDWIKIEDQGYCQLWANRRTDKRFQAYPISDAVAQDNVQLEKYAFRKMHSSFLVSAEAVITQNQTFLCSVPATAFVLIENIVSRLKSYPHSLTFEEGLYVLSCAASGYNTLCSFFGPLEPSEDMICFNDAGCVKVWLNENLSKNEASPSARSVDLELPKADDSNFAERRSRECVQKLLKIVELATIQGFPRGFKEETRKLSTFFEISNFVDYFCVQNNITILDHVELRRQSNVGQNQVRVVATGAPVGSRVQPAPLLQSSRVNQVFQSNHHLRDGNPIFLPPAPQQQLPPYRPPVHILPPNFGQNHHQVSYIVAPAISSQAIHPHIIVNTAYPPPFQPISQPTQISIRTEPVGAGLESKPVQQPSSGVTESISLEPAIIHNEPIKAHKELVSVYVEPERQVQQIVSTPQQPQQIVLPVEGSLNKNQMSEIQQPQFYEEDLAQRTQYQQEQKDYEIPTPYEHEEPRQQIREEPREYYYGYNEEQPQQQEAIHEYHNEYHQQQVVEQPQPVVYEHRYQQYRVERQPNTQSVYSNIEQYIPPPQPPLIESIEQRREEQIISPKKQSEIDEWSQKLDNFAHSQGRNQHPKQPEVVVETKEPESFKNLVVSDKREEYVNELADLESDDIEKYIRMKYQSYLKEQAQTVTEDKQIELSSPQEVYRPQYDSYKPSQGLSEADAGYKEYYKTTSYEYKNPLVWQSNQDKYEPIEYQSYQPPILPSNNTNRFSIEQDLQQPDYTSSRRNQPSSYGYRYTEEPRDIYSNQYQYPLRERESQRRSSNRNSNIIDQKYSKYVLNSKPKRTPYNPKSQDVSLILPTEESHFLKQTPIPIVEKSFDHDSFSYNKPSAKKGITYEKLRNLLWEE